MVGLGVLAAAAIGVGGCATTHVSTDYDRQAQFGQYRTFALQRGTVTNNGVADPKDTLLRDRIDSAVAAEMNEKGLRYDQANPDLIVTYSAGTDIRQELVYSPDWTWGWGPYWSWSGSAFWPYGFYGVPYGAYDDNVWVDTQREGKIAIDVFDADTHKLVYRTEARADDKNFRNPDHIRKAVDKALAKYPPAAG